MDNSLVINKYLCAGFWRRTAAQVLDAMLFTALSTLVFCLVYGAAYFNFEEVQPNKLLALFVNNVLPMIATVLLWVIYKGTPGKLLMSCHVVNAKTGKRIGMGKALLRYLAYFISVATLGLGFLWVIWDPKRQGFHDKIAGTVVLMEDETKQTLLELAYDL